MTEKKKKILVATMTVLFAFISWGIGLKTGYTLGFSDASTDIWRQIAEDRCDLHYSLSESPYLKGKLTIEETSVSNTEPVSAE